MSVSAGNLTSKAIGFFIVAYLARVLGPQGYGQISWALAAVAFGSFFADLGLQTLGIRAIAQQPENLQATVSNYVSLKVLLSMAALLLMIAFALVSGQSETVKCLTILFGFTVVLTAFLIEWVFTGLHQMQFVGVSRVLQQGIYAIAVFLIVHGPESILLLPVASMAGYLASVGFLAVLFRRQQPTFRFRLDPKAWPGILRLALSLSLSLFTIQVYINLPTLLLGWFKGETDTGFYSGALRLMQVLHELLGLFFLTLYPVAAARWKNSPDTMGNFLERVFRLILTLSVPIAMGALVAGRPLLALILGDRFASSVLPFQILIWNLVVVGINGVYAQLALLMNGKQTEFLKAVAVGAFVSLALNLVLIPTLSYVGAAIAWVVAEIGVCLSSYWLAKRFITLRFWPYLLRPLAAAGIMVAGCWLLVRCGMPVWTVIPLGVPVYGLALMLFGGFDKNDLDFIRWLLVNSGILPVKPVS